jgi:hypothetical protein
MKKILLLISVVSLIATTGCLVSDGRRHGDYHEAHDEHFEHHETVVVAPPAVIVRPPEIIVR